MRVYEKLRDYIDTHGLSRTEIAEAAGLTDSSLDAMLSGKQTIYAEELKAICLALGISADLFVGS